MFVNLFERIENLGNDEEVRLAIETKAAIQKAVKEEIASWPHVDIPTTVAAQVMDKVKDGMTSLPFGALIELTENEMYRLLVDEAIRQTA